MGTTEQADSETFFLCSALIGAVVFSQIASMSSGISYGIAIMCFLSAGASVGAGFVTTDWLLWIMTFILGFGFGNFPAIFAQMACEVSPEEQGRVQGANCESHAGLPHLPYLNLFPSSFFRCHFECGVGSGSM